MQTDDVLLTTEQLAAQLQVPVATVYRWNHVGTGPRPIHVGRHVRYRRTDIDSWIEAKAGRR
jgi:excisionase family DNA binding protein